MVAFRCIWPPRNRLQSECRAVDPSATHTLAGAVRAVSSAVGQGGWGYNRSSGPDADSTAWACRFLAAYGAQLGGVAARALMPFLDTAGGAHTFREPGVGRWGEAHADVTPIVGLALAEASGAALPPVPLIRDRVIRDQAEDGYWTGFWWATDIYATVWSLVFLARTAGIPATTAARGRQALRNAGASAGRTALEQALLLLAWTHLDPAAFDTLDVLDGLLATQLHSGGWPPSALLLVPDRFPGAGEPAPPAHADGNGLMTIALACAALAATFPALRMVSGS
jgi:hypothetical protein